jgi:hypothetical protein
MRTPKLHVRLEHAWHRSPKLLRASAVKGVGDSASLMWAAATTWCNENLKDGRVDRFTLASFVRHRDPEKVITALVEAGAFVELGGGDIEIHDFLEHNPSRAEVERLRQARREGGSKGGRPAHPADPVIDALLKQKRTSGEPSVNLQGSVSEPSVNLGPNQTEPISHLSSDSYQEQRDPPVGPPRPPGPTEREASPAEPAPPEVITKGGSVRSSEAELGSLTPITPPNPNAPKPSRKKPATACPPSDATVAEVATWTQRWRFEAHPGPAGELVKFLDHHRAKGSLFADWGAAWRTWLRNAAKFARERGSFERPVQRTEGYQATEERKRAAWQAERDAEAAARGATLEDPFS